MECSGNKRFDLFSKMNLLTDTASSHLPPPPGQNQAYYQHREPQPQPRRVTLPSIKELLLFPGHEIRRHSDDYLVSTPRSLSSAGSSVFLRQDSSFRMDSLSDGTPVPRACGDCFATHTSGHWCQDNLVVGGYICQKCYRRRKRSLKSTKSTKPALVINNKTCEHCRATDSKVWFKHHTLLNAYICYNCRDTQDIYHGKGVRKVCHGCGLSKSTRWVKDNQGNEICRKCTRRLVNANTMDSSLLYFPPVVSNHYVNSPRNYAAFPLGFDNSSASRAYDYAHTPRNVVAAAASETRDNSSLPKSLRLLLN